MAENYVLFTDSACDIHPDKLAEWNVKMLPLAFLFTDTNVEQKDHDEPIGEFYKSMRAGRVAKTSCVNEDAFENAFTEILEAGQDILYLGLSGGLSVTPDNAKKVAERLAKKYPDRKIEAIDSLSASAGEGLFVYLAVKNRDAGMTLEENAEALRKEIPHVCHWFTVEDLVYLKRGGRVSAATALLGTALNVKPVLHVDNEGHLIKMTQVHGRKKSIKTLAEKLGQTIRPDSPIFISNADCLEDAEMLKDIIKNECGMDVTLITSIGSVIGAHAGPGTLALFFMGKER
ncbi:DegV family protein [Aristaeella hokkaidonensis]|jgi:DegV family protein with EDD domain|uniref:DegV family protein n=1 Tax=Aristaeella hokkaidonensis TaxID=3046382 RepID=A0AC61N4Q4_9FIRM|nr:DegV family protein [Aristaeella hokkaidonensis]QUC65778.1 DegV family protein [Aristaeella hokkaidonensis]SNT94011.1 EDD domain protein, DegV family [Aristaeella hokkaidonensis]